MFTQKEMSNRTLVVALVVVFVVFLFVFTVTSPAFADVYSRCAVVSKLDHETDIVTVEDACGCIWQFKGCEDYFVDDIVIMQMVDICGTESIFDDVIIDVCYSGFIATNV